MFRTLIWIHLSSWPTPCVITVIDLSIESSIDGHPRPSLVLFSLCADRWHEPISWVHLFIFPFFFFSKSPCCSKRLLLILFRNSNKVKGKIQLPFFSKQYNDKILFIPFNDNIILSLWIDTFQYTKYIVCCILSLFTISLKIY